MTPYFIKSITYLSGDEVTIVLGDANDKEWEGEVTLHPCELYNILNKQSR